MYAGYMVLASRPRPSPVGRLPVGRVIGLAVAVVVSWASAKGLSAAEPEVEGRAIAAWMEASTARDAVTVLIGGCRVTWVVEEHMVPPPEELAALRREASQHPQHPLRQKVAMYDAIRAGKPPITRKTLWFEKPGVWRLNVDLPIGASMDVASCEDGSAWHTGALADGPGAGVVVRAKGDTYAAGGGGATVADERMFLAEIGRFIDGGLSNYRAAGYEVRPPERAAEGWLMDAVLPAGPDAPPGVRTDSAGNFSRLQFVCRWAPEQTRAVIDVVRSFSLGEDRSWRPTTTHRLTGWRHEDALGTSLASVVERDEPKVGRTLVYRLEGVERLPAGAVAAATRRPGLGESDPGRPDKSVRNVDDRTRGTLTAPPRSGSAELPSGIAPGGGGLRLWGWLAAAVSVAIAVGIGVYLRRERHA